jgi:hypothetical protein
VDIEERYVMHAASLRRRTQKTRAITPSSSGILSSDLDLAALAHAFRAAKPFHHVVIADFFAPAVASRLVEEFPRFDAPLWAQYDNPIEVKKTCNHWDRFPPTTYMVFNYLNSPSFVSQIADLVGCDLFPDPGLHGGGWHAHGRGGKLNVHLDYSIHPKLGLERRVNLIVYLTPGWKEEWGGALGLWAHNQAANGPGRLAKQVECRFNRAIIFDTSQSSWHGLPEPLTCPEGVTRNSVAVYYVCRPRQSAPDRGKALFHPHGDQANDPAVLELIRLRSQVGSAAAVYRDKKE